MSSWRPEDDIVLTDSEDEENEEFKKEYTGREAIMFVVDANLSANMERLKLAMDLIRNAFISGLLLNNKDMFGVMFNNTEMNPEPFEPGCLENIYVPQNCAVFLPPRQLTKAIAEHFLRFHETIEKDFATQYGVVEGGSGNFASMLGLCVNLFQECGYKLDNSQIVYMTDKETPHHIDSPEYKTALLKAKVMEAKEIEFHVIPMVDDFEYEPFYKEFITLARAVELDSFVPPDAEQLREILSDRKLKQDFLRRCLGHFKFSIGPNLVVSATFYNYFRNNVYPKKVKVLRKNNAIVRAKQVIVVSKQDEDTLEITDQRIVKTSDGWHELNVGAIPLRLTAAQVNRVRNLHAPGMMLLGFKEKSSLPENLYYKPCFFMYPDDKSVIGSKRLFYALWNCCLEREKIAICLFMLKRKSIPRYVALIPVAATESKVTSNDASQLTGDGFKIMFLPMAKHLRNIDFTDWNSPDNVASEEGVQLFEKIIKKLRVRYQPSQFKDPELDTLQKNLLALALNIPEGNDKSFMPDTDAQDERLASILPQLDDAFGVDPEPAKKRTAKESAGGSQPKLRKINEDQVKSFSFIQQLAKNNELTGCTVAQLREILREHFDKKAPQNVSKAKLIETITNLAI